MKVLETARPYDLPLTSFQKIVAKDNKCIGYIIMEPNDFLDLTTPNAAAKKTIMEGAQPLEVYMKSIRNRQNSVMPFLYVEVDRLGDKVGTVVGHEGRHRAAALMAAGKKRMPVAIAVRPDGMEKQYVFEHWPMGGSRIRKPWDQSIIPTTFIGQFNSGKRKNMSRELKTFTSFYGNNTISLKEAQKIKEEN